MAPGQRLFPGPPAAPRPGGHRPGGMDAALVQALARDGFAAGRGSGARGVPAAGSCGRADHAGDLCARDRGSRDAPDRRVACAGCALVGRAVPMSGHLGSAGEAAAGGPGGPDGLWAQVPAGLRSPRLSPETIPEEYRSAFRYYRDAGRTPVDLSVLPGGLRKEIAWSMFRVADLGGVIGMSGANTVVHLLGAAIAADSRLAGSQQVSLLDAS